MLGTVAAAAADGTTLSSGDVAPFLNGCDVPLGPGFSVPLSNGDELEVGTTGVGVLTVQGGCTITFSNPETDVTGVQVGGFPGTTTPPRPSSSGNGTVYIDGAGSSIMTNAGPSNRGFFNVGRFGATSTGELYISNGGSLTTSSFNVGIGGSSGTAVVDGPGSSVQLSGAFITGVAAGGTIGSGASGNGALTFRNGATISMVGGPTATSGGPGFTVGSGGGIGTFTVESGAAVTIDGTGTNAGTGPGFTLGNNGTGTLTLSAASLHIMANSFGGGFTIGTNAGTGGGGVGTLTIENGASVLLDGPAGARPGFTGGSQPGSTGTLNIRSGATLTINRSSAGCCATIGRLGHGVLYITNGGQLIVNDTSGTGGGLAFGGNSTSRPVGAPPDSPVVGGTFDALVSGQGSALIINSAVDGVLTIGTGTGAAGAMTVNDGAALSVDAIVVGRNLGSAGVFNVSDAGTVVSLVGDPGGTAGAGFAVGTAGLGAMSVTGGGQLNIDGTNTPHPSGFIVGGSRLSGWGGAGTLTVSGAGSRITAAANDLTFNVGFDNTGGTLPTTGTITVEAGGQILLASNGRASIGTTPDSTGTVTVTGGGSLLDAGAFLGIGKDRDGNLGGTGTLTVSAGGTVRAATINCGAGGTINGNGGTLQGTVIADPGCTIAPGSSPGTLSIEGELIGAGAKIVLEVDAFGNHDVLGVTGAASFDSATEIEVRVDPGFQPPEGTVALPLVQVQADAQSQTQPLLTLIVPESGTPTVQVDSSVQVAPVVVPVEVPPGPGVVQIDIKPGASPNVINLGSSGAIPVAILSSAAFDASTVNPETVRLDGAGVKLVGKGSRPLCAAEDVNGDGLMDLVCHIVTSQLPAQGDGIAVLTGTTFSGTQIQGSDFVKIVP